MQKLTRASEGLYRWTPDERFASVADLWDYCQKLKEWSTIQWVPTADVNIGPMGHSLRLPFNGETFSFTDRSFTQLCSLAVFNGVPDKRDYARWRGDSAVAKRPPDPTSSVH